jgi:hypothetical protein
MLKKLSCLLLVLGLAPTAQGETIVQELFDGASLDANVNGQGASWTTSLGFAAGSVWNAGSSKTIVTANNADITASLPGLSPQGSSVGKIWNWGAGYENGQQVGDWGTGNWATRKLAAPIDLAAAALAKQTVYFSFRVNNAGDTAMGVGLASGSDSAAKFFGVGATWDNYAEPGHGNAVYVAAGSLNATNGTSYSGPYGAVAKAGENTLNGTALLVGRLSLTSAGVGIDVKQYDPDSTIDAGPASASWTLSTTITDAGATGMTATDLLVWMNGQYQGELDAIRIGQTWEDVTGVKPVPEPSTIAMLLTGALGAACVGLRRRWNRG